MSVIPILRYAGRKYSPCVTCIEEEGPGAGLLTMHRDMRHFAVSSKKHSVSICLYTRTYSRAIYCSSDKK
jgi:hypothetical protein